MPGHFLRLQEAKWEKIGLGCRCQLTIFSGFCTGLSCGECLLFHPADVSRHWQGEVHWKSMFPPPPGILFYSLPFRFSGFRRYFLHQFSTFVCNRLANSNDGFQSNWLRGWRIKNRFNVNSFIHALMGIMHGPAQYTPDLCRDARLHLAGIKSARI